MLFTIISGFVCLFFLGGGGLFVFGFVFFKQVVLKSKLIFWSKHLVPNMSEQPCLVSDPTSSQFLNTNKTFICNRAPAQSKIEAFVGILSVILTKTYDSMMPQAKK